MTIKVEMQERGDVIAFAFETNKEDELHILDALKALILGDAPRDGGFFNSKRFIVHAHGLENSSEKPRTLVQGSRTDKA